MECFIKKIWQNRGEDVHSYFIRFSKGNFENRAVLNLQKSNKIKFRGSFEWANDFARLVSEIINQAKVSGIILSKEDISGILSENNIQGNSEKKKGGLFYKNNIPEQELNKEQLAKLVENSYSCLLDLESQDIKLKTKKKLPKPGKSGEGKVDDKFCQLEADLKYWPQIKDAFMLPECKKCKISHTIIIEDLILPQGEKDFAKIREMTKRKGRIIRKTEADKQETKEEKEFVA